VIDHEGIFTRSLTFDSSSTQLITE
jgi:hypothetical protein